MPVRVILEPLIVVVTFVVMTAVGTDLTIGDLRRVVSRGRDVAVATLGQWLLLPAFALVLVAALRPSEPVALGLLLTAACPGGAMSNAYVFLARADTALSVTLTALSTLAAVVTLPLLLAASLAVVGPSASGVADPLRLAFGTLAGAVLLPVLAGMAVRRRWPEAVLRHGPALRRVTGVVVVVLTAMIVVDQRAPLGEYLGAALLAGLAYAVLSLAAGRLLAGALRLGRGSRFAVGIEFLCRNMAIFALIGVPVLGRPDVLGVGILFFLLQVAVGLGSAAAWHSVGAIR